MMQRCVCVGVCVVLVSGAAWAVLPAGQEKEQPAVPQAVQPDKEAGPQAEPDRSAMLGRLLDQTVDMKDFQIELSLKDMLILLYEKVNADGKDLPIRVDVEAFKRENPEAPDVDETKVRFPPVPRRMTISAALHIATGAVPTGNATFIIKAETILVTTITQASIKGRLKERIVADYQNKRLSEILRELSALTGCSIVIDQRAATDANRPVTATFRGDANLAAVLRTLTDMCSLKAVIMDGMVYVTTPAQAEILRKEQTRINQGEDPLWPMDAGAVDASTIGQAKGQ